MDTNLDESVLFFTVGIGLILYIYIIWDIYRKDFRDEWIRTLFLALVMLIPMAGMVAYAVFSRRFINSQNG